MVRPSVLVTPAWQEPAKWRTCGFEVPGALALRAEESVGSRRGASRAAAAVRCPWPRRMHAGFPRQAQADSLLGTSRLLSEASSAESTASETTKRLTRGRSSAASRRSALPST